MSSVQKAKQYSILVQRLWIFIYGKLQKKNQFYSSSNSYRCHEVNLPSIVYAQWSTKKTIDTCSGYDKHYLTAYGMPEKQWQLTLFL